MTVLKELVVREDLLIGSTTIESRTGLELIKALPDLTSLALLDMSDLNNSYSYAITMGTLTSGDGDVIAWYFDHLEPSISNNNTTIIQGNNRPIGCWKIGKDFNASVSVIIGVIASDDIINSLEVGTSVVVTADIVGASAGTPTTAEVNGIIYNSSIDVGLQTQFSIPGTELILDNEVVVTVLPTTSGIGIGKRSYTVDTVASGALTAALTSGLFTNVINIQEYNGVINFTGLASGDYSPGDSVGVTVNGNGYPSVVQPDLTYSINVNGFDATFNKTPTTDPGLVENHTVTVVGSSTDLAGNPFNTFTDVTYTVDYSVPVAATIAVDPITGDDFITYNESLATVFITGVASSPDLTAGQDVLMTVDGIEFGGNTDGGGNFTLGVPGFRLFDKSSVTVSITIVNSSGNFATTNQFANYTTESVITATLDRLGVYNQIQDGILNRTESLLDGTITGVVILPATVGDTVSVDINGTIYSSTVDPGLTYSIPNILPIDMGFNKTPTTNPTTVAEPHSLEVIVGTSSGPYSSFIDYVITFVTPIGTNVDIDDVTADNNVDAAESATTINITGTITGPDVSVNQDVQLRVNGTLEAVTTLSAIGTFSIPASGANLFANTDLTVRTFTSNAAGNETATTQPHAYTNNP